MSERHVPPDRASSRRPRSVREVLSRSLAVQGSVLVVEDAGEVAGTRLLPGEYPSPFWGHLLALRLSGPHRRVWRVDGRTSEGTVGADDVGVVPAGQPFSFEIREATETLSVVLREGFVGQIAERAGVDHERAEVLSSLRAPDPPLARLVRSFLPELGGGGLGGKLYAEALANQLAVYLLRHHSSLGRRHKAEIVRPPAGPVPKRAVSRALDYIGDNLSGTLSLAHLAEAAGYSPNHFAKLFGEATGLPPHRYIVKERVEKARGLLEGTELPLAEVARLCGFSGQSHMGRAVKTVTGATPARLRRESRR